MIDTKKEQERDELHRAIWAIADELRGAVDGWDFKNYVLGTMFYRYISENLANYISEGEIKAGNDGFDYAKMSDAEAEAAREGLVQEKGFFILPSELFCNVLARCQSDENLNETLETVFRHIEESAKGTESEGQFAGLFDDFDVNSNKLGATVAKRNEKLCKLLIGVADMNLGDVKDHDIDAFGDAYEYLMTMYASNAGKSGGEFFMPADVSELLTRLGTVGKTEINKVYDPACGSGSLLLKAEKVLGKDAIRNGFYGQEINITTYNLCRINMFLHDIGFDKFDIACENTLTNPAHWDDEPFELIVSNPPYSIKWEGDDNPLLINDPRFSPAGVLAPKSKADMAFIMHSLSWLAANGTAAIVCFPGILYRGGAEQKIRRYLVENNFVDCIIQLPANLFFGTSIATCILVMKKGKSDSKTLFIDASNECIKVTNNNKLTPENIDRIVDTYAKRAEIAHFSHLAAFEEIEANNFNLSVSTYVEQEDKREKIDIVKLNAEIEEIVKRENVLREEIRKIIGEIEKQYEYHRDKLLTPQHSELLRISDIATTNIGLATSVTKFKSTSGVLLLHNSDIQQNAIVLKSVEYITEEFARRNASKILQKDDIITVHTGDVGTSAVIDEKYAGAIGFTTITTRIKDKSKITPQYLCHYLNSNLCKSSIASMTISDRSNLNQSSFEKLVVPVPPLEAQNKIVQILDNFDSICSDLKIGLSAEIEARTKQYEYYRDKLLSFKETPTYEQKKEISKTE